MRVQGRTLEAGWCWYRRTPLKQVLPPLRSWLAEQFPLQWPDQVMLRNDLIQQYKATSLCWFHEDRIEIRIQLAGASKFEVVDGLVHEWAHAHVWSGPGRFGDKGRWGKPKHFRERLDLEHQDDFWLVYGRAYRRLWDEDGWDVVREYV